MRDLIIASKQTLMQNIVLATHQEGIMSQYSLFTTLTKFADFSGNQL